MAKLSDRLRRKGLIEAQILAGRRKNALIVKSHRDAVQAAISRATANPRFATSAAVRNALYAELRAIGAATQARVQKTGEQITRGAAKNASRLTRGDLRSVTDKLAGDNPLAWERFSKKHAEEYIQAFSQKNAPALVAINAGTEAEISFIRNAVTDTLRKSGVTGQTMRELQNEMGAKITKGVGKEFVFRDRGGKRWNMRNYLNMVTRTTTAKVTRDADIDAMTDVGLDLAVIAGGPSTGAPDDPCWQWFGKIVSVTGETKGYPTWADAQADGVGHPNCIHYLAPVLDFEVDNAKEREGKIDEKRRDLQEAERKTAAEQKAADKRELRKAA